MKFVVAARGLTGVPEGKQSGPELAAVPQQSCGRNSSILTTKAVVNAESP
jgi:hypothetical protein